jgi:hypothetical protein
MAKLKKKANTKPRVRGTKIVGPSFEGWEKLEGRAFGELQRAAVSFYYSEVKRDEIIPYFFAWMSDNGYTKEQVALAKKAKDTTPTAYVYSRVLADGCPDYNKVYADYWNGLPGTSGDIKPISEFLRKQAEAMIQKGEKTIEPEETEAPKKVYKPSIQQIVFEQCIEIMGEIDDWLDEFDRRGFDAAKYDINKHFAKHDISQVHARKIKKMYTGEYEEFQELLAKPKKNMSETERDMYEQLKEGYSHVSVAAVKRKVGILQSIMDACDMVIQKAAAKRKPRTPKARSSDKIVKGIKYLEAFNDLALVSINPVEIVGASELWVYNVKTRKIGKYVASNIDPKGTKRPGSGLSMKGTTLQGFDEKLSVQKTLRKPDEKLKEFKACGKVALRKFMDSINTTESSLNGRINADTILLKVQ